MKRLSVLFLVLTLIVSSFTVVSAASGAEKVMSDFNVMPMTCSADSDNLVTRRDFAYTIANILGSGVLEPRDTEYVDVTADMEDSGYIYQATVNGFLVPTGNLFCPDDPISFHDFNQAVVKLLAYETIAAANGGGEGGNMKTVMDLHLYNGVKADNYDTITATQYRKLIYNLLTANITDFSYSYDADGNVNLSRTGANKTILSQYFGISRYYGSVVDVDINKPAAKFTVTKNVSEVNPTMLAVGGTYTFLSNGKVDLNFYKNIPVELWADKDGVIVYIAPQSNVRVFYDVIYNVNNITDTTYRCKVSALNEIEFTSEKREYKFAPGVQVSNNGETVKSTDVVGLVKKYAKIVMIDNKVTFIETWDLSEGGLITEINNSYIAYNKGAANTRFSGLGNYDDIIVVINGRSTDRGQIKPGSLFHFYAKNDGTLLVLVVSEKTIVGDFESYSSGVELEIGRHYYPISGNVYCSGGDTNFKVDDFDKLFGNRVICYVDIYGNIRYMKADGRVNPDNSFTGYVLGYSGKGFEDKKIKIQKIHPVVEEVVVTLPDGFNNYVTNGAVYPTATGLKSKFDFESHADIKDSAVMTKGDIAAAHKKMFKFKVNEDNEVILIAEADYFKLFGAAHSLPTKTVTLDADGNAKVTDNTPNRITAGYAVDIKTDGFDGSENRIYITNFVKDGDYPAQIGAGTAMSEYRINDERFVCIYLDSNGKIVISEVPYGNLKGLGGYKTGQENMKLAMFGEENSSVPEFILLYGNMNAVHRYNQYDRTAYIESISEVYDVETDSTYYEVKLENKKFEWEFDSLNVIGMDDITDIVGDEDLGEPVTKLAKGMMVTYHDGAAFNTNGIYMTEVKMFPAKAGGGAMSIYDFLYKEMPTFIEATLESIDDYRVYVSYPNGDSASYMLSNNATIHGLQEMPDGTLKSIEKTVGDIPYGETIYFGSTFRVGDIYYLLD